MCKENLTWDDLSEETQQALKKIANDIEKFESGELELDADVARAIFGEDREA